MDDIMEYISNMLSEVNYKKLIIPTFIIILLIACFTYIFFTIHNLEEKYENKKVEVNELVKEDEPDKINEDIFVDVKGEVINPGVYKLKNSSRVIDAISAAGGISDKAYTRNVNLSKLLTDGDVIIIYSNKEVEESKKENIVYVDKPCICDEVNNDASINEEEINSINTNTQTNTSSKININTASLEELKTLDGIGDAKAKSIIEYRNTNGNFKSIDELTNVSGISEKIFSNIKENITV